MRKSWQYKEGRAQEEKEIGMVSPDLVKITAARQAGGK